ncbi:MULTISPECIES: GntR family transcriptional regulator [unclassified Rhodococcus (in: high G+C Gram-positive bacteria)]|uniref:GntR family transcriptional regulator n=1 Tax=unclassified Rhodococcus (in: high G+C Gram-positive bacteria) TaxID=192944 RepID=UPI00096A6C89|nr:MULTISPECIES: GntR family transcriptional regulator [unclassified Rhodococcus (in: high G+C Gram-positive bacteria)]
MTVGDARPQAPPESGVAPQRVLTRTPLRDQAVTVVRNLIADGSLPPGARLNEAELAMRLGISRGPLREAIQRLGAEGYIEFLRNRGAFVRRVTIEDVRHMYETREILEVAAARLAAERATESGVARLTAAIDQTEEKLRGGFTGEHQNHLDIHEVIFDLAENPSLSRAGMELHTRVRLSRITSGSSPERANEALAEHHWIISAIAASDPASAAEAMTVHLKASLSHLLATQPHD